MNRVQREAFRELLHAEGYPSGLDWLQDHFDEIPQLGICGNCGHCAWTCDPDTRLELCPDCNRPDTFSSVLILLGII